MNAENFAEYIKEPAKLYQLPYQELKNLATEYPYVATIRLLLVLKSKMENDPKYTQYLHQLAARTFDRTHLQQLIREELTRLTELQTEPEEKLELKGLEELQEQLLEWVVEPDVAEQPEVVEQLAPVPEFVPPPIPPEVHAVAEEPDPPAAPAEPVSEIPEVVAQELPVPEPESALPQLGALVSEISTIIGITAEYPIDQASPAEETVLAPEGSPLPKRAFDSWAQREAGKKRERLARLRRKVKAGPKENDIPTAKKIARRSVQDSPGLVSETLAKLLAEQGQHKKAIKMYERLSLLFPQKSRYFAGIIENLKQKS